MSKLNMFIFYPSYFGDMMMEGHLLQARTFPECSVGICRHTWLWWLCYTWYVYTFYTGVENFLHLQILMKVICTCHTDAGICMFTCQTFGI